MKEKVSELCHTQWAGWIEYMFSKGTLHKDGSLTLLPEFVERWTRQMNTSYDNLSENEKASDRIEADKFINLFERN